MSTKRVYLVTTHGVSEFIPTPPRRHPLCPPGNADWTISKSSFSDEGTQLIWCCDIETAPAVKPPSKFHPNAGKPKPAKKPKPKPKTAKKAPVPAAPAPKPAPAPPKPKARKPREKAAPAPKPEAPEARVGER